MRQIQIERAVLIGGNHTEAGERFAVGVDIDGEMAAYLVRNGVASDPDAAAEVAAEADAEAEKPEKPAKAAKPAK